MDYSGPPRNSAGYGEEQPHYGGIYEAEGGNYGSIDNIDVSARLKHDSSSSEGKLFVGGIAWETPQESLSLYFSKYGEISNCVIMYDKISGRPRGFGFVTFADPEVAEKVLEENHVIDGRTVEVKRTVPREHGQVRGGVSGTKKIFVGGLPVSLNEDDLNEYFSTYGNVVGHQIMVDRETGRSRGFGFITFDNEDAVERVLSDGRMHEIGGKQVEIKRAEPKRSGFDNPSQSRPRHGGSSSNPPGNSADGSQGFAGGYGGKMAGAYGYGGFGNMAGNYGAGALGFYPGYGGYGYGYGAGGPFYGGGAYGGGGFGVPVGYGGAAGYGVHNGYNHGGGGGGGGEDEGFESNGNEGVNSSANGSGGEYGGSRGHGSGNTKDGRFHPYRK